MPYTPLTQQQFQKAVSAGFSTDQIIQHEKTRKQSVLGQDSINTMNDTAKANPTTQSIGKNLFGTTKEVNGRLVPAEPGVIAQGVQNFGKNVGQDYMDMTKNLKTDIQSGTDIMQQGLNNGGVKNLLLNPKVGAKEGVNLLKTGADTLGGIFAPITELIKPTVQAASSGLSNNKTFQNIANGGAGNAVAGLQQKYQDWKTNNPTKASAIESGITDLMAALSEGEANKGVNATTDLAKTSTKNLIDTIKPTTDEIGNRYEAAAQDFKDVKAGKSFVKANSLAGKIVQGDISDVAPAKNALSNIDMSDVESAPKGQKYQALQKTLDDSVKEQKATQQAALDSHKGIYKLSDLSVKVGNTTHNFVSDSLDQLQQYYEKTNDVQGQSDIASLRNKANTTGLTLREIDDLAVRHGQDLNAYNANGELASGLSKQAAENTRTGLKNTVADRFGNEAYKAADSQLSDTIRTRELVSKVSDKANALQQKIIQRGWMGKIGYGVGKGLDIVSGGFFKNFVNYFIPRGEGLKTLNALDLENMLQKNLQTLQDLTDSNSQSELMKKLNQAIEENNAQPEPIAKGETTTSVAKASDLGRKPLPSNIKVNDYRSEFPKYFTKDQVDSATEMLNQMENQGKTIDMKAINQVVKRVKNITDIKPSTRAINELKGKSIFVKNQ